MMKTKEFCDRLRYMAEQPTVYNNKYPYNVGYVHNGVHSFDCYNLIKTLLCPEYDIHNNTEGYKIPNFKTTGDIDGATMLSKCTTKSTDFSKITKPGTYLYMSGHAGVLVDPAGVEINGHTYNTIEATGAWERKVLWSWTDSDGTRRRWKGGEIKCRWTNWGLLPWVDYTDEVKIVGEETKAITGAYTIDAFRYDVFIILGVSNAKDALAKTVTISTNKNKSHKLVTPLERYFTALGTYSGGIEADKGKAPCFGNGMKNAIISYQRDVVKATAKNQDGILSAKGATWKKLLGV